eukprot:4162346-Amphidinium_carterae.1
MNMQGFLDRDHYLDRNLGNHQPIAVHQPLQDLVLDACVHDDESGPVAVVVMKDIGAQIQQSPRDRAAS